MSQKFKSDIEVQAGLRDSSGSLGTSGQVLSTTGTNTSWINQTTVANDVQNTVKAGVAINKGQAVYVTGADGTNIIVGLASNTTEATSSKTLGLLNATVATNGFADVVQIGKLAGLNTIGATAGDPVWLGVNGNLIYGLANKPYAPAHLVFIGIVTRVNANNGEIFVNVQNGFELKEIHDVDIVTNVPINGDVLGYDGTLWVNKTIAEWLGYTPANASGTTNYVSKFTGATTLGNSQIFDNGTNVGIGDSNPGYKLTVIGNGYFNDNVLIGNGSQLRFTIPGINIKPELVSSTWSDLSFSTNNSEKMRITSSGNVGIGTSSPSVLLQISKSTTNGGTSQIIENTATSGQYTQTSLFLNSFDGSSVSNGALFMQTASTFAYQQISANQTNLYGLKSGGIRLATVSAPIIFANGASDADFSTERMRITSAGNVGIGTSSPSEKLEVQNGTAGAKIKVSNTGGGYATLECSSNATSVAQLSFTNQLSLIGGNVGIGTTSPSALLNVIGNIHLGSYSNSSTVNLENRTSKGIFIISTDGVTNAAGTTITYSWANGGHGPLKFNNASGEVMQLAANGNVGIGTSSPTSKLTVNDSTAFSWGFPSLASAKVGASGTGGSFMVMTPSLNSSYESGFAVDGTYNSGKSVINLSAFGVYSGGPYSADIAFKTATNTTLSEKMRITNDGNVGIGTTSPSSILHLNSAVPFLSIQGSTTGSLRGINIMQGTTVFSSLSAEASLGETRLSAGFSGWGGFQTFHTNGSEKMRITSGGNVGIGTSSPSVQLNVIGQVIFDDGNLGAISPEPNSILQLESDRKGFLPPRLTETQRNNIGTPVAGLMIFNKDSNYLEVYDGSNWRALAYV